MFPNAIKYIISMHSIYLFFNRRGKEFFWATAIPVFEITIEFPIHKVS